MNQIIYQKLIENKKLLDHLKENSYFIKYLNRDPKYFKDFENQMKAKYKERITDKISGAIDGVEMLSSVIDTLK